MKLINLPNIITCCNVLCGCMAVYFGIQGDISTASLFIVGGAVFDFFDGMTARALHISGPIGKELDSLADMVSFGLAPSVLAYQMAVSIDNDYPALLFAAAMLMTCFSALRLAKFNCDERQSLSFIGLPTPANALFWIGLSHFAQLDGIHSFIVENAYICGYVFALLLVVMSYLLICELPMFSLKIKPGHMGWAENKLRYTFLALTVAVIIGSIIIGQAAASLAFIILLYIIMSVIGAMSAK